MLFEKEKLHYDGSGFKKGDLLKLKRTIRINEKPEFKLRTDPYFKWVKVNNDTIMLYLGYELTPGMVTHHFLENDRTIYWVRFLSYQGTLPEIIDISDFLQKV